MRFIQKVKDILEEKTSASIFDFLNKIVNFSNRLHFKRIENVMKMVEEKPLILGIETISVCNAKCVFCAYPTMTRKKEVMPLDIFEKVVSEYSQMGGGALSLTPVMGDPLLDPHFIERYKILEKYPEINQISFTTNGVAFAKYSDQDLEYFIRQSFLIQVSIGGLDKDTYRNLYGIDKLEEVLSSVERLLNLKNKIQEGSKILLAFRTNLPDFENLYQGRLQEFKKQGALLSHIYSYNNYGGEIKTTEIKLKRNRLISKSLTCAIPLMYASVYSNGRITNCGCVDANGHGLTIGDTHEETVKGIWNGQRRELVLNSFKQKKIAKLCQECNAYRPSTYLGTATFKNVKANQKLPIEFYLNFFGG